MYKPWMEPKRSVLILLFVFLSQVNPAGAQEALSDSQVQKRLESIHSMLEQGQPNADRWWTGWLIGYSAATIVQGAIGLTSNDQDLREDMALGAATTFLGAMGQIMMPAVPRAAPNRIFGFPESTPAERRAKLSEAERLFRESAFRERDGKSWETHAITSAVNLGSGLVVWLGFKRSIGEGLVNFALNMVVTEVQIWTQPTRAIRDYDRYMEQCAFEKSVSGREPETYWSFSVYPSGVGISFNF